jgi:acetyltransferase-like isoleucine patch superfamily enzyme
LIDPRARVIDSRLVARVRISSHVALDRCTMIGKALISIGEHSILTGPVVVRAELNPIMIGKFCSIGSDVAIWEANHHWDRASTYYMDNMIFENPDYRGDLVSRGPVVIGNDVWIGGKAVVLSGVTIGDGAVIGAGAIVVADVPAYAIVAGSPARVIRRRFSDEICKKLSELCWWDWDLDRIRRNQSFFLSEVTVDSFKHVVA